MSGIHRDDRPALVALGLILFAIVLVALIDINSRQPSGDEITPNNAGQVQQQPKSDVTETEASASEFDFWRDSFPQYLMAGFAVVATGVSWRALFLLRKTFEETKRTADAANNANKTARQMGEAQVRAYVSVSNLEGRITHEEPFLYMSASMHNAGRTPARRIEYKANLIRIDRGGSRVISYESRSYDEPEDLLPDASRPIFNVKRHLTEEEIEDMKLGRVRYAFEGRIHYWPVVGDMRRETRFNYAIKWNPKVTTSLGFSRTHDHNHAN